MHLALIGVIFIGLLIILFKESKESGRRIAEQRRQAEERRAKNEWMDKYGRVD